MLPLNYKAIISADNATWSGEVQIPLSYLPPGVDKFQAMAIHGVDPKSSVYYPGTQRKFEQITPHQIYNR